MKLKTISNIARSWTTPYNEWTKSWEEDERYMKTLQTIPSNPICAWRIAMSQIKPGSKVLALGCGAGREVKYLVKELRCKVTALDHSEKMISLSKVNEPNAKYILGDMVTFSSKDKFDYIICLWNSINFIPTKELRIEFINRCYSNLKPKGVLLIQTGSREGHWKTKFLSILYINKDYYFKESQISEWFSKSHFTLYRTKMNGDELIYARK